MEVIAKPCESALAILARRLATRYDDESVPTVLQAMVGEHFHHRIALVSSFGTESVVLLHMVSQIDPALPVVFLNTGKLFDETLRYRERLVEQLGLSDVRDIQPDSSDLILRDHDGELWGNDPEQCCIVRKVEPLNRVLAQFSAWITGRKRMHGGNREALPIIEVADGRIKVNPLARWSRSDIDAYITEHKLDRHPLEAEGYSSVGCAPCTDRTCLGEGVRGGRWRGSTKTECGIHLPAHALSQRNDA